MQGLLTNSILTHKGVKQGRMLSPTLFAIYTNDLINHLHPIDTHPSSLEDWHQAALLFVDDSFAFQNTYRL